MQDSYDIYDRLEDEALERLRDISAMSDEETDTESEAECWSRTPVRRHITLTIPSVNTEEPSDEVTRMLNLFEQTFEYESGWDAAHQDVKNTTFWRRIAHPSDVVFKFVMDGEMSCCVVLKDKEEIIIRTIEEFKAFIHSTF